MKYSIEMNVSSNINHHVFKHIMLLYNPLHQTSVHKNCII